MIYFKGSNQGINADIKLNNFLLIGKLLQKGTVGFAESYMDGDFSTHDLKNLLIFAEQNESCPTFIRKQGKMVL